MPPADRHLGVTWCYGSSSNGREHTTVRPAARNVVLRTDFPVFSWCYSRSIIVITLIPAAGC